MSTNEYYKVGLFNALFYAIDYRLDHASFIFHVEKTNMGYIEDNLVPGETVIFRTGLHWAVIVAQFFNAVITGAAFAFLLWFALPSSSSRGVPISTASFSAYCLTCSLPLLLLTMVIGLLNYFSSEFGLTNRRVMIKTGIIRRHTLELNLGKVESFQVREPLIGRLLGYKTIIFTGSGGTHQKFHFVARAREFQKKVTEFSTDSRDDYEYRQPASSSRRRTSVLDEIDLPDDNTQQLILTATQQIQAGNRQAAQQIVRGLIQSDPNNADVWYLAGYLSSSSEKKREAFERALRIDPTHRKARQGLNNL